MHFATVPQLAALIWTAPLAFFGLALLALPVIAHLLNRRAKQRVVFPTIMMLQASKASQSQLFRLRRWLLLMLRCLAVVAVVLAFAGPLWTQRPAAAAVVQAEGASVVVLLDASASTTQRVGGVGLMQTLRASGLRVLDELEAGRDRANVVVVDAQPTAAFEAMTTNLAAVRQQVEQAASVPERADWLRAIAVAGSLLADQGGDRRVVIVSDLQAANWRPALVELARANPLPEGVEVTVVPPSGGATGNVSLGGVTLQPYTPVVGGRGQVRVAVRNHATTPVVRGVTLEVDGRAVDRRDVELAAERGAGVVFDVGFDRPGWQELRVVAEGDALSYDDAAYLGVRVGQQREVVVIGDDPPDEPGSATYFTVRALAPRGDLRDRYSVTHLTSADATEVRLRSASVVVLTSVGAMSEPFAGALQGFVAGGGGLVMFSDGDLSTNAARLGGLMPYPVVAQRDLARRGAALQFGQTLWRHPALSAFSLDDQEVLQRVRFGMSWEAGPVRDEATVLMRFDDGTPAVTHLPAGGGNVLVCNFSPALSRSDFGKFGGYVALVQSLTRFAAPTQRVAGGVVAGGSVVLSPVEPLDPAGGSLSVVGPDGQRVVGGVTYAGSGRATVAEVGRASSAGFYRLRQGDRLLAVRAVGVDGQESGLERVSPEEVVAGFVGGGSVGRVRSTVGGGSVLELDGEPLWGWLVAAAMGLLGVELGLLTWWRR
ncbi:MAG: BatA domain-containing protein [Planctomycetota bacterium]